MTRLLRHCVALVLTLAAAGIHAADEDNLLPVEEAFKVEAHAVDRGTIKLDFKIADDYYLYRERMKVKSVDANVTLGALDLPAGEKKHDEFLGDVEVYHHGLSAMQHHFTPYTGRSQRKRGASSSGRDDSDSRDAATSAR